MLVQQIGDIEKALWRVSSSLWCYLVSARRNGSKNVGCCETFLLLFLYTLMLKCALMVRGTERRSLRVHLKCLRFHGFADLAGAGRVSTTTRTTAILIHTSPKDDGRSAASQGLAKCYSSSTSVPLGGHTDVSITPPILAPRIPNLHRYGQQSADGSCFVGSSLCYMLSSV